MEQWYYEKNGEQYGPVSREDLVAKRVTGEVSYTNLVWSDGMKDWAPFGETFSSDSKSKLRLGSKLCPNCGEPVQPGELIPAGDKRVCPKCRDSYAQALREGLGDTSAQVGRAGTGGMTPNREIRSMARDALSGRWGSGAGIIFVVQLIQGILGFIPGVGAFATYVIAGPFMLGQSRFFLGINRDEPREVGDAFSGFSAFGKAFGIYFVSLIIIGLACMAAAIPGGVLIGVAASSGFETMEQNPIFFLGIVTAVIPVIIVSIYMYLRYALIYFIALDHPELGVLETLKYSVEKMNGHKMKLFSLVLSFIGWHILGMLAFFIGLFWSIAYMNSAFAAFYDDIGDGA